MNKNCIYTLLFLFYLIGCSSLGIKPQYEKNWPLAQEGMTKEEIQEILGEPDSVVLPFEYQDGQSIIGVFIVNTLFDGWHERWCYGKSSIVINSVLPVFPGGTPGDVHVVYFNQDGKVVKFRKPFKESDGD